MTAPDVNTAVLEFLKTRRSAAWNALTQPAPNPQELHELLEIAARVPDHGILVPWRFIVLQGKALKRLSEMVLERGTALNIPDEKRRKVAMMFDHAPMIVAVILTPKPSDISPEWEQRLTTGAVCMSLLNGAQAAGWGANWLTGWIAQDRKFMEQGLGLSADESVSGFVHLGTCKSEPNDRVRPDVDAITTWVDM